MEDVRRTQQVAGVSLANLGGDVTANALYACGALELAASQGTRWRGLQIAAAGSYEPSTIVLVAIASRFQL